MLHNLLLTAFRNIKRNTFFSVLNIFGLATGMTVFMLITQYVRFERSYEDFVPDKSSIYRVGLKALSAGEVVLSSAENYPAVGPAMKKEIPGVDSYARLYNMGYKNNVVISNDKALPQPIAFNQERFLYADEDFLPMMGYRIVKGNAASALSEPNTAVISEKYARMYFGNQDPIGKTLHMKDDDFNDELARVTAVIAEVRPNTHLKFDILFSYKTLLTRGERARGRYEESWQRADMYTFVRLRPGTDPKTVEARLTGLINKYKPELTQGGQRELLFLQPLKDIHLHSDLAEEPEPNGSASAVLFISIIGIFVLVIAWINYVNLATARAVGRAKEVGIRKVIGAHKYQLILQFLTEAAIVNLCAVVAAILLSILILPYFNTLSGLSLTASYFFTPWFFALVAGLWIVGSLLSGFYPALVLSSFKPIIILKGKFGNTNSGVLLRKGLVIVQFMTSVALIAGTLIVYQQLHFMLSKNIGVNINQVMVMARPGNVIGQMNRQNFNRDVYFGVLDGFRNDLKSLPDVEGVSSTGTIPGKQRAYKTIIKRMGAGSNDSLIVRVNSMDYDFMDVYKMKLLAGRPFSKDFPWDPDTSMIITESTAKLLGFKSPQDAIGKLLSIPEFGDTKPIIVGVVNDYHQLSFKKPLEPTIFYCDLYGGEYYSLRLKTTRLTETVEKVQTAWTKRFPSSPFSYFFLDDYFNKQYSNEQKFGNLFTSFSILAIILSCLGLFGLSAYTATQRIKEIGIRKVLGASVINIATMLSVDFLKLVIISIVVATPFIWFVMKQWLSDFAYRIDIGWWFFLIAGTIAILIALLTVSYQAIKAAMTNPVKSLRSE